MNTTSIFFTWVLSVGVLLAETSDVIPSVKKDADELQIISFEVYGTELLKEPKVKELLGKELEKYFELVKQNDTRAIEVENALTEKLNKSFNFESITWSWAQGVTAKSVHVTLDVVEKKDKKKRMPFRKKPQGEYKFVGNLDEKWREYLDRAYDLARQGKLDSMPVECPQAHHCLLGHTHKDLVSYGTLFYETVNKNQDKILKILRDHKDEEKRATAMYLYAYTKDPKQVVKIALETLLDPSQLVRNNALRVLNDMAVHDHVISLEPILNVFDYPTVTDRSKALMLLVVFAHHSKEVQQKIKTNYLSYLLTMLSTKQPQQQEPAHELLKMISGQTYAINDVDKWKQWIKRLPASK